MKFIPMASHRSKYTVVAITLLLVIVALLTASVSAAGGQRLGNIRIEPHSPGYPEPIMLESPATFTINVEEHPASEPHILLVMSKECWESLQGPVTVTWPGAYAAIGFAKGEFVKPTTNKIPTGLDLYTAASLRDHLGVPGNADIYYATGPFLGSAITETAQTFTVTLPSTDPRMLVYAYGKSKGSDDFNNVVPNSRPGFVIPEVPLGPAVSLLAMFAALVALSRRYVQIEMH